MIRSRRRRKASFVLAAGTIASSKTSSCIGSRPAQGSDARDLERSRPILCFIHDARRSSIPRALLGIPDRDWLAVDLLQVRGKALAAGDLERLTASWMARLQGLGPRVIVNDRMDVALACGAAGAHLGQDDLPVEAARAMAPPEFLIGASTHSPAEIAAAEAHGASYAGLGAFFATRTKRAAVPLDPSSAGLDERAPDVEIPVLAIGGLTAPRVAAVLAVPVVTGVAVSAAVQEAEDPAAALRSLRAALDRAWTARQP